MPVPLITRKLGAVYPATATIGFDLGENAAPRPPIGNRSLDMNEAGCMRTIGIDLAVQSVHKAIVADAQGYYLTPVLRFQTHVRDLAQLLARARADAPDSELQVVMEPTSMAWFPIAVYLAHQRVTVYLVNAQQVADLRRYYKRHAKSGRIDARVLARLPLVNGVSIEHLVAQERLARVRAEQQGGGEQARRADYTRKRVGQCCPRFEMVSLTTTYASGVKLTKDAMQLLEAQIQRHPELGKWFVDIVPAPPTLRAN
jgi:transposase